jgi:hypothetical protein
MYFDNLTLVSLLVFAGALGVFIYACLYRGCISGNKEQNGENDGS